MKKNPVSLNTIQDVLNHIKPWLKKETLAPSQRYILIETSQDNPERVLSFHSHQNPAKLLEYLNGSKDVAMIFQLDSDQTAILPNGEISLDMFESNQ